MSHFREHLAEPISNEEAIGLCADYGLIRDIADATKHSTLNRCTARMSKARQLKEVAVVTEFCDDDRLDKKNEEIIKLNRDINAAVTGGNSFCYLLPTESAAPHVMLIHSGEHPLYDVEITILDLDVFESAMVNAKLQNTEDVLRMYNRVAPGNLAEGSWEPRGGAMLVILRKVLPATLR